MAARDGNLKLIAEEVARAFSDPIWAQRFPPVLSIQQVAELLQVPVATIYGWSSQGLLKGCRFRVGKHVRIFRDRLVLRLFNEGIHGTD